MRLETYESEANQAMVRKLLHGKLANTTFVVLAPDGETQLSRASRSPTMSFSSHQEGEEERLDEVLAAMQKIASKYPGRGAASEAFVPEFHSFKQALNVSSADQRLLLYSVAAQGQREGLKLALRQVANDPELRGKFHYDMAQQSDADWAQVVDGVTQKSGHFVIRAGSYGQDGEVVAQLPLGASAAT